MSRAFSETLMGAVVLAVAAYFVITVYAQSGMSVSENYYAVKAQFNDITGISQGSDVRIGGVKVGTVQSMSLNDENYQAEVHLELRDTLKLPIDTTASIIGESLLGGKFIALTPGGDDMMMEEGDMIEFTQSSISLEQLLGKFVFSGGGVDSDDSGASSDGEDDADFTLP